MLTHRVRWVMVAVAEVAVATVGTWFLIEVDPLVDIVMKAAGIPKDATGLGGFINGAHALVTPALVMVAAIAPLALIAGGLVLLFGGRRGLQIIGTALGVLLLLGSVTALID